MHPCVSLYKNKNSSGYKQNGNTVYYEDVYNDLNIWKSKDTSNYYYADVDGDGLFYFEDIRRNNEAPSILEFRNINITFDASDASTSSQCLDFIGTAVSDKRNYRFNFKYYHPTNNVAKSSMSQNHDVVTATSMQVNTCYLENRNDAVTISVVFKKRNHSYSSYKTSTEPTCTNKGSKYRTCTYCNYKETTEIAALGHTSVYGGTASVHTKCSRCGVTTSTAHSYTSSQLVAPTCTIKGTTKYTCACGYSYTNQDIDVLGHDYQGEYYEDYNSVTNGLQYAKCTRSGCTSTKKLKFRQLLNLEYRLPNKKSNTISTIRDAYYTIVDSEYKLLKTDVENNILGYTISADQTYSYYTANHGQTIILTPRNYNITFNQNGAITTNSPTSGVVATYAASLPSISVLPKRDYVLTFDSNGGKISGRSDLSNIGNYTYTTPYKYTFNGYYNASVGGTQYYNRNGVGQLEYDVPGILGLYSQWSVTPFTLPNANNMIKKYTVKFQIPEGFDYSNVSSEDVYADGYVSKVANSDFSSWLKNGSISITTNNDTPTDDSTYQAQWVDKGVTLVKLTPNTDETRKKAFIGWFTAPQTISTLANGEYVGGLNANGINQEYSDDNNSYYYAGGDGDNWDYSQTVKLNGNNEETITLYPWFNEFPEYSNPFEDTDVDGMDYTYDDYGILLYEGQSVLTSQLLPFVSVSDLEDDELDNLGLSDAQKEDKLIEQLNKENLKLKVKKIQYGSDIDNPNHEVTNPLSVDTSADNIGVFYVTYEIIDDGIVSFPNLISTNIKLTIVKSGIILKNNTPTLDAHSYPRTLKVKIDESNQITFYDGDDVILGSSNITSTETKNAIKAYLSKVESYDIDDLEDSHINLLPWWIKENYSSLNENQKKAYDLAQKLNYTVKDNVAKNLLDTIEVTTVSNVTFDATYGATEEEREKMMNYIGYVGRNDSPIPFDEFMEQIENDVEMFSHVFGFEVGLKVTDQFGKTVEDSVFVKIDKHIPSLPNPMLPNLQEASVNEEARYISDKYTEELTSNDDSMWSESYFSNLLQKVFDKYKNRENYIKEENKASYKKYINGEEVEIPITIHSYK